MVFKILQTVAQVPLKRYFKEHLWIYKINQYQAIIKVK